ncbi:MAG TPA: AAA domain-containing protein [Cytophagales bacterium]|nr:AAA domain-containing protein [Cytophagales bacterium]
MKKILKSYLNRLTNLTGNNRSILLLRLTGDYFFDLHDLDFKNGQYSFAIIESLIGKKTIKLCEYLDSRDGKANEYSTRLKNLNRKDKFITEERGSKDLYVGWPFVKGKLLDDTLVRAPLIFFPVELTLETNQWKLSLRNDEAIALNKSLLLAYAHYNKITLSEEILEKQLDDWDKNSQVFRTSLYTFLKESGITINFNQDLFINELIPFENYKKADFEGQYKTGELKMYSEAVLGIFPQAGSYLVPDYNFLLEQEELKDLEEFFYPQTEIPEEQPITNKVKEEQTFTPYSMDASQENSIKAVKKGQSLVVQGPPGSGKSQLICNLIADHIARGKRVLMVCQKRVALDVVYQRLKQEGINDFVALVHDFKNDRKAIYSQIQSQIERISEYQDKNNSLDAIYLERTFLQTSRKIDQLAGELEEFKNALFDASQCGISIKELYLTSEKNDEQIPLKEEYKYFSFNNLESFLQPLKYYLSYSERFEKEDYLWKDRVSFQSFSISDFNILKDTLIEIPKFQQEVLKFTKGSLGKGLSFSGCEHLLSKQAAFNSFLELSAEEDVFENFKLILDLPEDTLFWLQKVEKRLMQCYEGEGPELTLEKKKLGDFQAALQRAEEAFGSPFIWIKWRFSKERFWLKRVLVANNLKGNRKGIESLIKKLDNRLNLEHNLSELKNKKWIVNLPENNFKIYFQGWIYKYKQAFHLKDLFRRIEEFFGLDIHTLTQSLLKEKIAKTIEFCELVADKKKDWMKHLQPTQIDKVVANPEHSLLLLKALEKDFDALAEYDQTYSQFSGPESAVIKKLLGLKQEFFADDLVQIFINSLKLSWIEDIEQKYPILRTVSTLKFRQLERELQQNVQEKLRISRDILLLKLRETTYQDLEVNRLNNLVTYRDLSHQVTKKRSIWPVRKLIGNFSKELFNLVPCWMASPESVSAIFPMEPYFDLVIFDEASQCYAENGIPSIYRGRQIVITGDSKQLNPNDIYKSRWEETDEELPEIEIDSLLDLGARYLKETQLSGHYRSKTLELIDFSNHHFYKGKLSLMPNFEDINNPDPSIEYIKVDGVWENNSNEIEATKVGEKVIEYLKSNITDIGVVTFNFSQQNLILNVLETFARENSISLPDNLFVKNIENVQGDEREIIIFSTAYAPDLKGKLSMNFGTLNAKGGENRLNVAITRAKQKIIIISSIYPNQLKVENLSNEGPKLFKQYLQYALDVSEGRHQSLRKPEINLPFEGLLKHKLIKLIADKTNDKILRNNLPFTDLSLVEEDKYKGIILTDDELYYQSISIKESHVYKKLILKNKGWKFMDFYSREYWNNKESIIEGYQDFKLSLEQEKHEKNLSP